MQFLLAAFVVVGLLALIGRLNKEFDDRGLTQGKNEARSTPPAMPARRADSTPTLSKITGICWVVDGDTIVINGQNIRLFGIDAPELEHPWGQASKFHLVKLCKGQIITAEITGDLSYDRLVAKCWLPDGRDLSSELVKAGLALDWKKYSGGQYRHLEPQDARRKLWRAAARQRGDMRAFNAPR